jgi:hypothetical protein
MAAMNPFAKKDASHLAHVRRVKAVVRAHFRLGEDETILVTELACQVPGCPPLETVIAFWGADEKRRHYKVFKPVAEVVEDDLPPWWMKDALVQDEVFGCPCC